MGAFFCLEWLDHWKRKKRPIVGAGGFIAETKKAPFLALVWLLAEAGGDMIKQIIFYKLEFCHAKLRFSAIFDRFHDSQIAE